MVLFSYALAQRITDPTLVVVDGDAAIQDLRSMDEDMMARVPTGGYTWKLREVASDLRANYISAGFWTDSTFASFIDEKATAHPELPVTIWSATRPAQLTVGELYDRALRLAASFSNLGIRSGDVIAYQLPNWAEAISVLWAGFRLGAVMVPIAHHYGAGEVEFILEESGARTLVTVDRFGHVDHLDNLTGFRNRLSTLEHVITVPSGKPGPTLPGAMALNELLGSDPYTQSSEVDPDMPAMVGYTSGTTAQPKGVVHTHRSLLFEVRQLAALDPAARTLFSASPVAHMTGMLSTHLLPLYRHNPIHLTDKWDPTLALQVILDEDVSSGSGATVFLTDLLDHPNFTPEHAKRISSAGLGGSPVPAAIAERAEEAGITIYRSYGSTEHPSVTGSRTNEPREKRNGTDGHPLASVDLRLVDVETEGNVETGKSGEIWTRGADLFAGYTDPALTAHAFTSDGWYRTGDIGVLDDEGYLTITDRLSDIIIRGGANISAAEIEEVLIRMPVVAECAVVATPDERLGERAMAVVRLRGGVRDLNLGQVQAHLEGAGLPKQKWVEGLLVVDDFPRTPSGKIRKFVLRDQLHHQ